MASADWTELSDNLTVGSVLRGATYGVTPPTGGGSFAFGMKSITNNVGVVGFYTNQTDFAPTASGASVRMALKRTGGGGNTDFAPFLYVGLQSNASTGTAYILGLSDESPAHIVLRKGTLATGLPASVVGEDGILRKSTETVEPDTWVHLRLDMVVNDNGDVVLTCKKNTGSVASPSWVAIAGMDQLVDDLLGVNTGSVPLTSGRMGFAALFEDTNRAVYFDQAQTLRQT